MINRRFESVRARLRLAAVISAVVGLFATVMPVQASAAPRLEALGSLRAEGPIYIDETARLLYQVAVDGGVGSAIKVYNLDNLAQTSTVELSAGLATLVPVPYRGVGARVTGGLAAVDSTHHRFFYPFRDPVTSAPVLAVIDGKTGKQIVSYPFPSPVEGADAGFGIEALDYRAENDTIYALSMTPVPADAAASGDVYLQSFKAADGSGARALALSQCGSLFPNRKNQALLAHSGDRLYAGCNSGSNIAGAGQILKMQLDTSGGIDSVRSFSIPELPSSGMFDAVHERVTILNTTRLLAVFDGAHEVWVGLAIPSDRPQMGINPGLGRVYLCGEKGIGLFSTDGGIASPVPPGIVDLSVPCVPGYSWPIVTDGKRSALFLQIKNDNGADWTLFRDLLPAYEPPPRFNPDDGAQDIAEQDGLTQSVFSAQGAAFGSRVILVGGPLGALENSSYFVADEMRGDLGQGLKLRLAEGSREVRFARVATGKMSDTGLEAGAIAADRDNRVDSDLATIRQHPLSAALQPGTDEGKKSPQWPYAPALCFDFGAKSDQVSGTSKGASATCDFKTFSLDANAYVNKESIGDVSTPGLFTIGESTSHVTSKRDAERGAMGIATATSKNIQIAGKVFIAEVSMTAKAWAKGRPGTADAHQYERTFKGVKVLGDDGKPIFQCESVKACIPTEVINAINEALGPRITATMPEPDPEYLNGTPRGTTSSFRQNQWDQIEESVLFDKPVDDLTMAAVDFRVNANLLNTSGLIVQLAGVTASAGYRIFKLPDAGGANLDLPSIQLPGSILGTTIDGGPTAPNGGTEPKTLLHKIVEKIRQGMKLVFGAGKDFRSVLASWALLLAPLYIGLRRRAYLRGTLAA